VLGKGLKKAKQPDKAEERRGGGQNHFHFHGVKDGESFGRSRGQIAAFLANTVRRADEKHN
jgi:hypothetical protein